MPDFRRGSAAIAAAEENAKGGGNKFRPFTPSFFWKAGDEKYLLFLNALEDIPTADLIGFIPQSGKKSDGSKFTYFEQVIARTDPVIGESSDPIADEWDGNPKETGVAIAVELEPTFKEVSGRKRPTGFKVKTKEFSRRIRDEDGELTEEYEDVSAPVVGFVTQSPNNFFNVLAAYDSNEAPIDQTPLKISRVGGDKSTSYQINGYPDQNLDLSDLIDNIENVSYLKNSDSLIEGFSELEDDGEMSMLIGTHLLEQRLDELVDRDRYNEIYSTITASLDKFGNSSSKRPAPKSAPRPDRPTRSMRVKEPESSEDTEAPDPEEKPSRRTRQKVTSNETVEKLERMRGRAKAKASS